MSTSFTSDSMQIICINMAWIIQPLQCRLLRLMGKVWLLFIKSCWMLLPFVLIQTFFSWDFCVFILFEEQFMAPLSSKFSKAANRFEILSWSCFLTSISFNFLRLNIHIVWWCSFTYQQSVHKFAAATATWWISQSASLKYHTSWIFECHLLSISM